MHGYAPTLLSFLAGCFFFSRVISSLRAVNFGSSRSNRRIKSRTKAKVAATVLAALNIPADARARCRISRLRHCGLVSLRHTHVENDVVSRKTRCALRTRAPIGFAQLLGAALALSAFAAAPAQAQSVNIDPSTFPPNGTLTIPPGSLVPPSTNTITGLLGIGTDAGAGTLTVAAPQC